MKKFRWEFKKDITLYKAFGFALTTSRGSLGTLAGHEGERMFRDFNITFFIGHICFRLYG